MPRPREADPRASERERATPGHNDDHVVMVKLDRRRRLTVGIVDGCIAVEIDERAKGAPRIHACFLHRPRATRADC